MGLSYRYERLSVMKLRRKPIISTQGPQITMTRIEIVRALDDEIARLQRVKELLRGANNISPTLRSLVQARSGKPGRVMSEEGRRRIAEAQKRRWARAKA